MTTTLLISMMALIAATTAQPYFSAFSSLPYYGSALPAAYTSALVPGAVAPAPVVPEAPVVPAAYSAYPAPFPYGYPAELAAALSPYYNLPGLSNYAPLAAPYPVSAAYRTYAFGDILKR